MNKAVSLLFISALLLSACTTTTTEITWPVYTEDDTGLIVQMEVGEKFIVDLSDLAEEGYVLDEVIYENDHVAIVTYEEVMLTDSVGGKTKWTFEALKAGETDLIVTATFPGDESGSEVVFEGKFEVE